MWLLKYDLRLFVSWSDAMPRRALGEDYSTSRLFEIWRSKTPCLGMEIILSTPNITPNIARDPIRGWG